MSETKGPREPEQEPRQPTPTPPASPAVDPMIYPKGTVGAVIGAALGVGIMYIGLRSGFYAEVAIGLVSGWLASLFAKHPSWGVGAIAGLVTLVAGLWAEWKFIDPLPGNQSFMYFVTHVSELAGFKQLSHLIGVGAAVWLGAKR